MRTAATIYFFDGGGVMIVVDFTGFFSSMRSIWVTFGWFQKAAKSPRSAIKNATSGIQSAARHPAERYQNPSKSTSKTNIAVATRSGVCAQFQESGNSSQSKPPTTSA